MAPRPLAVIARADLTDPTTDWAKITKLQQLASYSWLDKPDPTIRVPGSPPVWSPPVASLRLAPDVGTVTIDANAARNPRFPLEPLFRALYTEKPDFAIHDVDLVTDRNNIRKLLRFVLGACPFRFQIRVEIVGDKTALFTRVEDKVTEDIVGFRGYGHSFEEAYTTKESETLSHHRIVGYRLGRLHCVVRHETNGYVASTAAAAAPDVDMFAVRNELSIFGPDTVVHDPRNVRVEANGKPIPLSATLEIQSRSADNRLDVEDVYPQLWMSQTPQLIVGYHHKGLVGNVEHQDVARGVRHWERDNQTSLRKLLCLLSKIIAAVRETSTQRAVVRYEGGNKLKLVRDDGPSALPVDLYAKWLPLYDFSDYAVASDSDQD